VATRVSYFFAGVFLAAAVGAHSTAPLDTASCAVLLLIWNEAWQTFFAYEN
jgi:hypothetical protein